MKCEKWEKNTKVTKREVIQVKDRRERWTSQGPRRAHETGVDSPRRSRRVVLVYGAPASRLRWPGCPVPAQGTEGNAPDHAVEPLRAQVRHVVRQRLGQALGPGERCRGQVDHVNLAELPSRAAAEVARGAATTSSSSSRRLRRTRTSVIAVNESSAGRAKVGKIGPVGRKSTYNPKPRNTSASRTTTSPTRCTTAKTSGARSASGRRAGRTSGGPRRG